MMRPAFSAAQRDQRSTQVSATKPKLPTAHPTKWTLLIVTPKGLQMVFDYDTQAEAERALAGALVRGERGFVQPPIAAWAGK